ncbi:MAG: tRNA preQ1(34) S-adenosylmethionine ribosyltransferase-isomerase QueA [Treponema sp.]|jgi:S-adenosylmethionine:tRNA ribosyltransferase-isomerase|nr:tRNA preQ1(34) S-adenosylmethionine ribosyltransferase-isomerase QueA [Treponema sp.]
MKTSDFNFDLPESLIAQYPPESRGQSRLMVLDRQTGKRLHRMVDDLPDILCQNEFRGKDGGLPLLVFNNSKVRKARLIGKSLQTGATVEFLLLEKTGTRKQGLGTRVSEFPDPQSPIPSPQSPTWKAIAQHAKRRKPGSQYAFFDEGGTEVAQAEITGREGVFRLLAFDRDIDDAWLDRYGHIPLPPYIKRQDEQADAERYQTVYAAVPGSAAAPTAGLHFTEGLLRRLAAAGIETAFLTLHVGLGTFLPVRSENIEDHLMHREYFSIDEQTAAQIERAKAQGRKVIAVGTTSVRTLESAWEAGRLKRGEGSTAIFIYPGYRFDVIDAMFTNFHTPESTLLMLVSAFAGRESILESYAEAIREGYRFFSYGDAMLIA